MSLGALRSMSMHLGKGSRRGMKRAMRNTVLSSKHTQELRKGREAVGQKSKSKVYGQDAGQSKEKLLV